MQLYGIFNRFQAQSSVPHPLSAEFAPSHDLLHKFPEDTHQPRNTQYEQKSLAHQQRLLHQSTDSAKMSISSSSSNNITLSTFSAAATGGYASSTSTGVGLGGTVHYPQRSLMDHSGSHPQHNQVLSQTVLEQNVALPKSNKTDVSFDAPSCISNYETSSKERRSVTGVLNHTTTTNTTFPLSTADKTYPNDISHLKTSGRDQKTTTTTSIINSQKEIELKQSQYHDNIKSASSALYKGRCADNLNKPDTTLTTDGDLISGMGKDEGNIGLATNSTLLGDSSSNNNTTSGIKSEDLQLNAAISKGSGANSSVVEDNENEPDKDELQIKWEATAGPNHIVVVS